MDYWISSVSVDVDVRVQYLQSRVSAHRMSYAK